MKQTHELKVKTGEYESEGKMKGRYQTVGAIYEGNYNSPVIYIYSTFNPAGVPRKEGSSGVRVYAFPAQDKPSVRPAESEQDTRQFGQLDEIPF